MSRPMMRGRMPHRAEPVLSVPLPPRVPGSSVLGKHGKIVNRIAELSGARLRYNNDDHRVDIQGQASAVNYAARLLERTLEQYLYSGLQYGRKQVHNVLSEELCNYEELQLLPCTRPTPAMVVSGTETTYVLACSEDCARQEPGASMSQSAIPLTTHVLVRHSSTREKALESLLDVSVLASVQHPSPDAKTEFRFYLGKLTFSNILTSYRTLPLGSLLDWSYPDDGRALFDTSLPQDTIRSLDRYLTSVGFTPTKQTKSASLHLESSIPYIQYHPTFTVLDDGSLALAKLETLGCKPVTVSLVGRHDMVDVRLRYVASVEHSEDDAVAAELRRRAEDQQFQLVNNVQVVIPSDLNTLDLTLSSARVKLKRIYVSQPMEVALPPAAAAAAAAPAAGDADGAAAAPPAAGAKRVRTRRKTAAAAAAAPATATITLKVSVAAVVDNLGGKRLEVTASCPELNAALMALHAAKQEGPGDRARLLALLEGVLGKLDELRANVEFQP